MKIPHLLILLVTSSLGCTLHQSGNQPQGTDLNHPATSRPTVDQAELTEFLNPRVTIQHQFWFRKRSYWHKIYSLDLAGKPTWDIAHPAPLDMKAAATKAKHWLTGRFPNVLWEVKSICLQFFDTQSGACYFLVECESDSHDDFKVLVFTDGSIGEPTQEN